MRQRQPLPKNVPQQPSEAGTFLLDMLITCIHATHMSRMIQVRNVPDTLHRTLKARAAMAGMSLSDYLLAEIREIAERPTLRELSDRLARRKRVSLTIDTARLIREERDDRSRQRS